MIRGVIGTAGHIDHGKTALIRALTGADTDRLPEEKRRGISIDLGFTHLDVGERTFGIVDVPGHEDFIRNMLAGTTGVDLLLLVVAADEGVMPQTREHLAIAELLEVPEAVVALTKLDLVEPAWLDLVREEVAETLSATRFRGAPMIATSAVTGEGLEALRATLVGRAGEGRGDAGDVFRMPVDRAFSVHGTGTVVTGTVWSGSLEGDATVRLLPGDVHARVRGLQVHGGSVARVSAGQRAAVALGGVDLDHVQRGMVLVSDAGWVESSRVTLRLRVLPESAWAIEDGQRVRVHLGTAEAMARVLLGDARRLDPGQTALAQLRLEAPLVARALDRVVIRSYSPVTTIAGGIVLDPAAPRRRPRDSERAVHEALMGGAPDASVGAILAGAGAAGIRPDALPLRTGQSPANVMAALDTLGAVSVRERVFDPAAAEFVRTTLLQALDAYHREHPLHTGMDLAELRQRVLKAVPGDPDAALVDHALDAALATGAAVKRQGRIAAPGHEPTLTGAQRATRDRIVDAVREAGVALVSLDELSAAVQDAADLEDLVGLLCEAGTIVRIEHRLYAHADVVREVTVELRRRLGGREGLTPVDFKEVVRVSRKSLIPLLEYFDRAGVTVRTPAGRRVPQS